LEFVGQVRQKRESQAVSREIILHGIELHIWPPSKEELLCKTLQSNYGTVYGFAELTHLDL
jgi:hypothetical protein